jgi:hypothetical protein
MPSKRAKGDRLLEDALDALGQGLVASGAPWMVIGGIAIIARVAELSVLAEAPEMLEALDRLLAGA